MIILINGPSSSGKSTLIDQFIKKSNKEFIKVAFDDILYLIHKVNWSKQLLSILGENIIKNKKEFFYYNEESNDKNDLYRIKFNNSYTELLYSMHSFWKILIDNGFNIIIDHIFLYENWYNDFSSKININNCIKIGIYCDLSILNKREMKRGDRPLGVAERSSQLVHNHKIVYDFKLNTHKMNKEECINFVFNNLKDL
jgi:chloramphenicol 3-O phosphotransferase